MWGTSGSDIYCTAVQLLPGDACTLYHYDGTEWKCVPDETELPNEVNFYGVWGTVPDDIYVTGQESVLYHWDGQTWTFVQGGAMLHLHGISGADDNLFFMVGEAGSIYEFKNGESNFIRTEFFDNLLDAYATPTGSLYVMNGAEVFLSEGGIPDPEDLPEFDSTVSLSAISGQNNTVFIVGNYDEYDEDENTNGIVYQYDGSLWTILSSGFCQGDFLTSIWAMGSTLFVGSQNGKIYSYVDGAWQEMTLPIQSPMNRIWGLDPSNVYAVGDNGVVLHYDGAAWSQENAGTSERLWDIWGSKSDDVYVTGDRGTVRHFDGAAWASVDLGIPESEVSTGVKAVCGRSASDILFTDTQGYIYAYDGNEVISKLKVSQFCCQIQRMVAATDAEDIYAVGQYGTILENYLE